MSRNESLQLQLATIIQEGHTSKATAYETAGRVLLALYGLQKEAATHKTGAPSEN